MDVNQSDGAALGVVGFYKPATRLPRIGKIGVRRKDEERARTRANARQARLLKQQAQGASITSGETGSEYTGMRTESIAAASGGPARSDSEIETADELDFALSLVPSISSRKSGAKRARNNMRAASGAETDTEFGSASEAEFESRIAPHSSLLRDNLSLYSSTAASPQTSAASLPGIPFRGSPFSSASLPVPAKVLIPSFKSAQGNQTFGISVDPTQLVKQKTSQLNNSCCRRYTGPRRISIDKGVGSSCSNICGSCSGSRWSLRIAMLRARSQKRLQMCAPHIPIEQSAIQSAWITLQQATARRRR
jgi:hypothetical protein